MAEEIKVTGGNALQKALAQGKNIESAAIGADGTVTIPHSQGKLQFVDIADVDLLLSFTDGTYVVIPNGALDAISDTPHAVLFTESKDSLVSLFKMVGRSNAAKAGSLRLVSENIDAAEPRSENYSPTNEEPLPELPIAPAPMAKISSGVSLTGKGPGLGGSGSGEGEGEVPATITPLVTPQPPVYRVGTRSQSVENILNEAGLGMPNFTQELYTSANFKVTPSGRSDLPLGAYDPTADTSQLAIRATPTNQATREVIIGTDGADTIDFNPSFSSDATQWTKTLHLTINNFSELTSIQLVFNAAKIAGIPGFELQGVGGVVVTRDAPGSNSWHVTPSADMLLHGADIAIVYNVNDSAATVDFSADVIVSGQAGPFAFEVTNNLGLTWRDAVTTDDFTVFNSTGDPLMVLPRAGVGVEVSAGNGDDIVNSGAGPDIIHGGAGNDTIHGGSGNDILEGGPGADNLFGDLGNDTATYVNAAATGGSTGITVRLDVDGLNTGDAVGDKLAGHSIENLTGSSFDDRLIGDSADNILTGGAGNDTLIGQNGNNTLDGGDGIDTASYEYSTNNMIANLTTGIASDGSNINDTLISIENLIGGSGNDTFTGAAGIQANAFDGCSGSDTVSYAPSTAAVIVTLDPTLLLAPLAQTNDASGDTFVNIENLTGSSFDDTLIGNGVANVLTGGNGNDMLEGLGGADTFIGGSGTDTVSYANSVLGVVSSLTTVFSSGSAVTQTNDAFGDTYSSIENMIGSGANDTLIGNSGSNTLNGGSGNDVLEGLGGADALIGGTGINTASYEHSDVALTVSLTTPGNNTNDAAGDTYTDIQNLTGSAFNDTLIGDSNSNILNGGDGNDVLEGMGGGADILNGGTGINTASYEHAAVAVTASLASPAINSGDAAGDTYNDIQNLTGSAFNDTLIGNSGSNTLNGGVGDDILEGLGGADTLIGGIGSNTASYARAELAVTASLTIPGDNTNDAAGDTYSNIQNLTGSTFNDTLSGDSGINILTGGDGNDTLEGFGNADTLIGGNGIDTASYAHASNYVVASLTASFSAGPAVTQAGDAAGDTYSGIENLTGSNFNDTLIGNSIANTILGGVGDDIMEGIGGSDTYDGGTGSNTVSYAHAPDVGLGVGVTASLLTPASNLGAALGDLYTSIQNLTGSDFNDTLTGDANNNILTGGAGNDTLSGGAGTDTLYGGLGDDILIDDGVGIANLYGEAGNDTFRITSADASVDIIDGGDKSALRLSGSWSGVGDTISWEAAGTNRVDVDMTTHLLYARSPVVGNVISFSNIENFTLTGTNSIYITLDNYSNVVDTTSNGTANVDYVFYQYALGSLDLKLTYSGVANVTGGSSVLDNLNTTMWADGVSRSTWTGSGDTLKGIENVYSGSYYADNIYGSNGVNNWLAGSLGADYINGGTGTNTVYLDPGRSQQVVASLLSMDQNTHMGIAMTDTAQGDVYVNIANLYSSGNDILYGNAGVNQLQSNGSMEGFMGTDNLVSLNGAGATASYAHAGDAYLAGQGITTAASLGVTANLTNPGGANFASYFSGVSATSGLGIAVANTGDALGDTYTNNMYGLTGSAYNDILIGNALNNTITGGDGDDLMEGLAGADIFIGGNGTDTVSYAHALAGVIMDLGTSGLYIKVGDAAVVSDAITVASGLVTAVDTYTNVENIIGSTFNDTLAGNSLANIIEGGLGNDLIDGGANITGYDIASYAHAPGAITISLAVSGAQNTVNAGTDTLINIEGLLGSSSNDTLTGSGNNNWIDGGDGADTLDGGAGVDTLSYSSAMSGITITLNDLNATHTLSASNTQGDSLANFENLIGSDYNDTLHGDSLSNEIEGGLGNDILDGGANTSGSGDTVSYAHATAGVTVTLATGASQNTLAAGSDTLSNFENLTGSDYNDTLTGDANQNIITGGLGDDLLIASGGGDTLAGGGGTDTVSFVGSGLVTMSSDGLTATHDGHADSLTGIANVIGSSNNDTLYGNSGDNIINGGGGNDYIDGGAGNDTVTFANAPAGGVTVDLNNHYFTGAYGGTIANLYNVEHIIGSGYNDTLTGNSSNNIIEGGAGNDWMDGGTGTDTASYSTAGSGVTVSLAVHDNSAQDTGGAGSDTLYYNAGTGHFFENLTGSAYNDILTGDTAANTIDGGAGDDVLNGGFGADILIGGTGTDTVSYAGAGSAVIMTLGRTGLPAATGDAIGDTFGSIENIIGSSYNDTLGGSTANNTITGGLGNDTIYASDGNDIIYANKGNDTAYGEANNDTFYVSSLTANLPTLIDGGTRDAGNIQNHGGNVMILQDLVSGSTYDMTTLATKLNYIDTMNIHDGVNSTIKISSLDVRNMMDNGNASQIFVEADSGDILNLNLVAGETVARSSVTHIDNDLAGAGQITSHYTDYTVFNSSNVQVAQIHWHTA